MHLVLFNTNIESFLYFCYVYEQMELRQWKGLNVEGEGQNHSVGLCEIKEVSRQGYRQVGKFQVYIIPL